MIQTLSEGQLLEWMKQEGAWTRVRAGELEYFLKHLPAQLEGAQGDPEKVRVLLFAFGTYLDLVQGQLDKLRQAKEELAARHVRA